MFNLLGILLILTGDVLLLRFHSEYCQKKIQCLEEMCVFLLRLTCDVTELKIPLEEAIERENNIGFFAKTLYQEFHRQTKTNTVRESLLHAIKALTYLPAEAKKSLTDYLNLLGRVPKETIEEYYRVTSRNLDNLLKKEKETVFKNKKLLTGIVYSVSSLSVLLLL